ncbi:MAG: hypothetical protein H6912_00555 [Kordiimonadaceae bacterium]|nr:hypothetical protein [Kordiimonadaceae bacterium]
MNKPHTASSSGLTGGSISERNHSIHFGMDTPIKSGYDKEGEIKCL